MRIIGIGGGTISPTTTRRSASEAREEQASVTESRALVAIEAPAASERMPRLTRHPSASFLAQLIATHMQAPQTRARRRAEPEEAIAIYRSMTKPVSHRHSFATRV